MNLKKNICYEGPAEAKNKAFVTKENLTAALGLITHIHKQNYFVEFDYAHVTSEGI